VKYLRDAFGEDPFVSLPDGHHPERNSIASATTAAADYPVARAPAADALEEKPKSNFG